MRRTKGSGPEWTWGFEETPVGPLILYFSPAGLTALEFADETAKTRIPETSLPAAVKAMAAAARQELASYFAGSPTDFGGLALDPRGTPFQLRVWEELRQIPWGATISYRELARRVGSPKAFRAVGQANAVNPLPIIVPCHRVIAADGTLGGYSSGLDRKRWLLRHEGAL